MTNKASEREQIKTDLFKALCAVEPEKSKCERIDDPTTQTMLNFFTDFILAREQSLKQEHERALRTIEDNLLNLERNYQQANAEALETINRLRTATRKEVV